MTFHVVERAGRTAGGIEYATKVCAPRSATPPHAHARPFFCLVLDGASAQTAGGIERQREPGRAFFYPAGEVHNEVFGARGGRIFSVDLLAGGLHLPGHSMELTGALSVLARRVHVETTRAADDLADIAIDADACTLAAALAREPLHAQTWMPRVRDYLHAHYTRRLSLGELARAAGVHPVHVSRAFPLRYGSTVGDYLRALRVDHAARELMTTHRPLAEIAFAAGFASQAHMTRHFRLHLGIPPAAYRRLG